MDFGSMQSLVIETTKRPDKLPQIKSAINAAVEYYTSVVDWSYDLSEDTISIDPALYAQSLIIANVFTRLKRIKYIRPTGQKKYLTWWDPSAIFDEEGCELINTWYRAGTRLVFKLKELAVSLEVGYYPYHNYLVNTGDTHWMLDIFPQMVHYRACELSFGHMGNDADARLYKEYALAMFVANSRNRDGVSNA